MEPPKIWGVFVFKFWGLSGVWGLCFQDTLIFIIIETMIMRIPVSYRPREKAITKNYKQLILDEVFVKPLASADYPYRDIDYSGYQKN